MRTHANKQAICNSYWILSHFSAKGNKNHHTVFIRSNRWLFIHSTCKQIEFFSFSHDFSTCVTLNVAHIMVRVLDWRSQSTFWFGKRNKFGIVVHWIGTHEFVPRWGFLFLEHRHSHYAQWHSIKLKSNVDIFYFIPEIIKLHFS